MSHKIKTKPEIRFSGYTDDWERRKLGEVSTYRNGKAHEKNISIDGKYIVINSKFISTDGCVKKYTNDLIEPLISGEIAFVLSDVPNGRALARTFLVNKNKKYSLNQRIAGITPNTSAFSYYLYILMNRNPYFLKFDNGVGQTNLSKSDVENFESFYPSYEEQKKIGTFFKQLDDTIALHQRQLEAVEKIKKSFLQKMFPKKDETKPEIRFAGFTDDWEQRKLGEISPLRGGAAFKSHLFKKEGVPIVRISNILENGFVGGEFAYYQQQENDEKYILPNQAIVLAMSGATTGKVSVLNNPDNKKVYQNQRVGYFLPTKTCDYKFISILVRTTLFHKQLESVLVAGAQPNISSKEVESFIFMIPSLLNEQQKIGTFFKQLDDTIALHQRQLEALETTKKSFLQKMFV